MCPKSTKNPLKTRIGRDPGAQKSSKNEAWEGPGGSGGWSWSHFGATGRKSGPRVRPGLPKGLPLGTHFLDFSGFFGVFSKRFFEALF